jgi:hypothetical protein
MNRKIAIGVAAFVLLSVGAAWKAKAGWRYTNYAVTVDLTNKSASGQMGGSRDNPDDTSYIGCHTWGVNSGSYVNMRCQARDAYGNYATCWSGANNSWWGTTSYPAVLDLARTISGDPVIWFQWDSNGNCTFLQVEQYSWNAPKLY